MRLFFAALLPLGFVSLAPAQPKTLADEQPTKDAIVKAGGKAETDMKLAPGARVVAVFESATDATLIALKKHTQIGAVEVYDATKCTEKGFTALKDLPNLRRLVLSKSDMTLSRVSAISGCKELRDLRLPGAGLSDIELAGVKKLVLLELLDLSDNAQLSDKSMATVKSLERLRALHLPKTGITDKGFMELKELDGLRTLYVGGTKVTAGAIEKFVDEMPNLRVVR